MSKGAGELILYTTEDGTTQVQLRVIDGTVWLTQAEMAELFQTSPQAITQLVKAIYADVELVESATCKELLQVRPEGARQVQRQLKTYSLEVILAIGYRVRSERGVQFRRWATTVLKEYLVKGFVMNDERLKDPKFDYFDELLERIRDIRASEARFYQKVRDILALSVDYDAKADTVPTFYATIQNKMLHDCCQMRRQSEGENQSARSRQRTRMDVVDVDADRPVRVTRKGPSPRQPGFHLGRGNDGGRERIRQRQQVAVAGDQGIGAANQGQHQKRLVERVSAIGQGWRWDRDGHRFTPRQVIGQQVVTVGYRQAEFRIAEDPQQFGDGVPAGQWQDALRLPRYPQPCHGRTAEQQRRQQ